MPDAPFVTAPDTNCYLVRMFDAPGKSGLRKTHNRAHLEHVEDNWQRYLVAGPLRSDDAGEIDGSAFLVLAKTLAEAKELINQDPFVANGLYGEITYERLTLGVGAYLGGKTWPQRGGS